MVKKVAKKKSVKSHVSTKTVVKKNSELPELPEIAKPKVEKKSKEKFVENVNSNDISKAEELETMKIVDDRDIAMDFALKVYDKFDQMVKSIVLFGSSAKKIATAESDIDIIIIIDDVSLKWDQELIAWYREELGKIIQRNPYVKSLHVNTVKLSTWWDDMMRGDPIVINVLRYGDALIDFGGFFNPLRILLKQGKIKPTPESIYTLLQRAPAHMTRARQSMLAVVDGLYWTMVDAAHAALIAGNIQPSSPEEIGEVLFENFVKTKRLDKKFVSYYDEIHTIAKDIIHGDLTHIEGQHLDDWFKKTDSFLCEMAKLVDELIEMKG